ncbi:hypothetical protein EIN_156210 [Entamoeba invadens IP1]|uniref:Uncharacterized protein n=1 Tax=Entamoeba invadens IP1 TaxID=370355 RepID=A0A0A1U977_ENTIV|nr:hypothetical protein EIN_156210 [Entamoeba invadens IP1]ELP91464.1 hypothetical protein EIN_156210 [Entamoeba invadens IP1]|eukprot:XP_004258235.1 hypothetical protein EIN_156210 [Entamoeba invadens IP1]
MSTLGSYHAMIVSKYFITINDFINLELVCKKFRGNMEKFHFNPIPLNSKTLGYFPNIETLHLWNKEDENFGNGFLIKFNKNHVYNGMYEDVNKNRVYVPKRMFYQIVVWFDVDYVTINDENTSQNIKFKNIIYTKNNRKQFGNNIPLNVTSIGFRCFNQCYS